MEENNVSEIFVPGRLCILGEHTDWAGEYRNVNPAIAYGMTIVCATNEGLYARVQPFLANTLKYEHVDPATGETKSMEMLLSISELSSAASSGGFYSYICGTMVAVMQSLSPPELAQLLGSGISINNFRSTLPMKKGLSSSAAICVLTVTSLDALLHLGLSTMEVMELAYKGEMLTPSRCGRMDQCVAMGPNSIGLMEYNVDACNLRILSCKSPLYFVVADLNAGKDTVCILQSLHDCFPVPAESNQSRMHRYQSNNQKLAWLAVAAIERGEIQRLANAMIDAQQMFDDCAIDNCPSELTSPRLHSVISHPGLKSLSLAAKGVGSQGDGTVQVLCRSPGDQQKVLELLEKELNCSGFILTVPATPAVVHPPRPLLHVHRVRCALLIVDPHAQGRFPFVGAHCPPCLTPIPWFHGTKSVLVMNLMELIACGVQRIAVFVPCMRGAAAASAGSSTVGDENALTEEEAMDWLFQHCIEAGLGGSTSNLAGQSKGTRSCWQSMKQPTATEDGPEKPPDRGAFKRRGSFTKTSSNWTYVKELFEIIRGRTRFFFDNPENPSWHTSLHQVVTAISSAAVKMAGSDGIGQLLISRAETILEASTNHISPRQPSNQTVTDGKVRYGLYGFIRDSLQIGAAHAKPTISSTGVSTTRLQPLLAVSSTEGVSVELPDVTLQLDVDVQASSSSNQQTIPDITINGISKPSQLQQLSGKMCGPNSRLFEGVALMPYDAVSHALQRIVASYVSTTDSTQSGRSPRARKPTGGMYMHPVDSLVGEILADIQQQDLTLSQGEGGVILGTMSSEQDKKLKAAPAVPIEAESTFSGGLLGRGSKILPIDLTIKTGSSTGFNSNVRESSSLPATPAAGTKYLAHEGIQLQSHDNIRPLPTKCLGVEAGVPYHVLSDDGFRRLLAHVVSQQ